MPPWDKTAKTLQIKIVVEQTFSKIDQNILRKFLVTNEQIMNFI